VKVDVILKRGRKDSGRDYLGSGGTIRNKNPSSLTKRRGVQPEDVAAVSLMPRGERLQREREAILLYRTDRKKKR